jgi:2-oxoglutarate dehydrogenase E1 component
LPQHPGTRKLYADKLVAEGVLPSDGPDDMIQSYRDHLDRGELLYNPVHRRLHQPDPHRLDAVPDQEVHRTAIRRCRSRKSGVCPSADDVFREGFVLHSRVKKIIDDRRLMGQGQPADRLGHGRESRLCDACWFPGYGVRMSGEDVGRSTFFHRHAALHDQNRENWDEGTYYPLANLQDKQATVPVLRLRACRKKPCSPSNTVMRLANPYELVVWEAQFGDFANGAQVVIDQFIASGEAKWGRACGLVLLLPHGYEGQGPEHSSARIERFMQLVCRDEHGSLPALDAGAGLPHAAPAGHAQAAQAADRVYAEVAAAAQGRCLDAG